MYNIFGKNAEELSSIGQEYGDVMELDCGISRAACEITKADGGVTKIHAEGYAGFIDSLKLEYDQVSLKIGFDAEKLNKIDTGKWDTRKNKIKISLASKLDELYKINLAVHGSGSADLRVPSGQFVAHIHGSGVVDAKDIKFGDAGAHVHGSGIANIGGADAISAHIHGSGIANIGTADAISAHIHGSGIMNLGKSGDLSADIHGSGSLNAGEVTRSLDVSTSGAGRVAIEKGSIEKFVANVKNGEVRAGGVTAKRAKIKISGSGNVEIGRVTGELTEECGKDGKLIIREK